MVGVMHSLLLNFVRKNWGGQTLEKVVRQANLPADTAYRLDKFYADEEWRALITAAVEVSGLSPESMRFAFARYAGEDLVRRFPGFFRGAKCARDVIKRQPAIHNFIAASVSDPACQKAIMEKFRLEERADETVTYYTSPNQECVIYLGLACWVADHFGEAIEIDERLCQKRGDPVCEIHIRYLGARTACG